MAAGGLSFVSRDGASPAATPTEWLRRASFDLTGLPPAIEDIAPFTAQWLTNPHEAKSQVVDRLLSSPAFGERWASVWLDLARYSYTYGFEKDPHRDIWPYRDWVIRAFNADIRRHLDLLVRGGPDGWFLGLADARPGAFFSNFCVTRRL